MKQTHLMVLTRDDWHEAKILNHLDQLNLLLATGAEILVQVRAKHASDTELEELLAGVENPLGNPWILDDRVELAHRLVGCSGVHVGPRDIHPLKIREEYPQIQWIGATVNSMDHLGPVLGWPQGTVQYIGMGPWRYTSTKKNLAPTLSLENWVRMLTEVSKAENPLPVYGIGGVQKSDLPAMQKLGLKGVAVTAGIWDEWAVRCGWNPALPSRDAQVFAKNPKGQWLMKELLEEWLATWSSL
jgi:thiamine-phosphate pyrophosphorylase